MAELIFFFKGFVNSPQFFSLNVLWSCNVHRQQPERSNIFIFFGLSQSHRSNSEKLRRFKIAADILIAFAGEFFTEEIEDTESLNVVQTEVSFANKTIIFYYIFQGGFLPFVQAK